MKAKLDLGEHIPYSEPQSIEFATRALKEYYNTIGSDVFLASVIATLQEAGYLEDGPVPLPTYPMPREQWLRLYTAMVGMESGEARLRLAKKAERLLDDGAVIRQGPKYSGPTH